MKIYLVILTIIVAATSIISKNMQDIPCFPGAEGGGAVSLGGRGGKIIQVTNLNNSGSGSLRAALEASGPRIVVFRQGGTINLDSDINVTNPFVTIAGQTAPGDGICIKGDKVDIHTHDVLMQYVRIRPGRKSNGDPVQCIFIRDGSYNIMVDHCSFSWATDENFTAYSVSDATFNITLSWSLICEGLSGSGHNDHAAASIFGSVSSADKFTNVSIHHNLMSHNQFRMPYVKIANAEIINNISYDWQHWCSWYKAGIDIDIIGNRYKLGASFGGESWQQDHGIIYCLTPGDNGDLGVPGDPTIYIEGNLDHKYQVDPDSDNWGMIEGVDKSFKKYGDISTSYRRAHRQSFSTYPVTVYHVNDADDLIFNHAGASRRLNENGEWIDTRDNVDARLINQYKNGAGGIINNPSDVGGWPLYTSGTPYIDSDKDGMPDSWERSNNLDPNDPHDIHYDADNE